MIPGDRIGGRFQVEQWVGAGGMGAVYRARDLEGGGLVAIKVLLSAGRLEEARFEREVEALAGLRHPGIVRYVAHGQTEGGAPWLAMGTPRSSRSPASSASIADAVDVVVASRVEERR